MNANCVKNVSDLLCFSVYLSTRGLSEGLLLEPKLVKDMKRKLLVLHDNRLAPYDSKIHKLVNNLYLLEFPDDKFIYVFIDNEKDANLNKFVTTAVNTLSVDNTVKIIEFPESKAKASDNIVLLQNKYPFNLVDSTQFLPIKILTSDEMKMLTCISSTGQQFTKISLSLENIVGTIFKCSTVECPQFLAFKTGNPVTGPDLVYKRVVK